MSADSMVTVAAWCGFVPAHPPHLWGDVQVAPSGERWVNVYPCPGERFADEIDAAS